MTHFRLGSSGEDPGGSLLGVRCKITFLGTSTVCLGGSAVPLGSLEGPLPGWLPSTLTDCLTSGEVVTCLGRAFPSRGMGGGLAASLGGSAITREGGTAWVTAELLPSLGGRRVPAWEAWEAWLPAWDAAKLLPSPGGRWVPACLPDWVACAAKLLPSPGGRWVPAWEVTALEAWEA